MLLALGASVNVVGTGGKRVIPLDKFFTLPSEGNIRRENVLKNDEIITEIVVPSSPVAAKSTYLKFKERESLDFALASAAVALQVAANSTVSDARIVLGGGCAGTVARARGGEICDWQEPDTGRAGPDCEDRVSGRAPARKECVQSTARADARATCVGKGRKCLGDFYGKRINR